MLPTQSTYNPHSLHVTRGDAWIVAGLYSAHCQRVFRSRLQTVIWLDLPLREVRQRRLPLDCGSRNAVGSLTSNALSPRHGVLA